jgi:hypothetical protein
MGFDDDIEWIRGNISRWLTEEEYYSKAIFSSDLLGLYHFETVDEIYCWPINSREGYIQQGKFGDKENPLNWALIYRYDPDGSKRVLMNIGDLLVHVPLRERLKWKKYFIGLETDFKNLDKILFCDLLVPEEKDYFLQFWKERINKSSD